jgi:hypothetical protein
MSELESGSGGVVMGRLIDVWEGVGFAGVKGEPDRGLDVPEEGESGESKSVEVQRICAVCLVCEQVIALSAMMQQEFWYGNGQGRLINQGSSLVLGQRKKIKETKVWSGLVWLLWTVQGQKPRLCVCRDKVYV